MGEAADERDWWRSAVVYQIYPRSFADGNGDGVGDLAGIRGHLDYLVSLGIDAIWLTPWYRSPWADGGYDVADYRQIDPRFGTMADAEALIHDAADRGIRTIIDIVPNHVSDQHPWFQAALASEPGSSQRARFWFRQGKGADGAIRPTGWLSSFQGHTWTRAKNPDGSDGEWYLHLFTAHQPDLNWTNTDVRREHEDVLKFWFDKGVAGFRIDSATLLVKDPAMPEAPADGVLVESGHHPYIDRDGIHQIYQAWRRVADSYDPPKVLVGEVWLDDVSRFAQYLRPTEMNTAFNFDFMTRPWDAGALKASIDLTLSAHEAVGAPATWVLSNHDITRPVTRYGRQDSSFAFAAKRFNTPTDLGLGTRRARAAALLVGALPGSLYIYQGDELGLPEDEEIPPDAIDDPMYFRSHGVDPGRDGCRVPLPWSPDPATNFGFSAGDRPRAAWLPQPSWWGSYAEASQDDDPQSMLNLYRAMLKLRRSLPDLVSGDFSWLPAGSADVLTFRRGDIVCLVNLGASPVPQPAGQVLIASSPSDGGVGADSAVWVRTKGV